MRQPGRGRATRTLAAGAAATLLGALLTGCGEDSGASEDSFTIGVTTPSVAIVGLFEAVETLRADGYDIDLEEVAEPELLVEGIANGEFQFSGETTTAAFLAAQRGADVKVIGDLVLNAWTLYGDQGVSGCDDLDGQRLAIHSQAAVSTAMVRQYIEAECPDAEPDYLVIAGSPNRYAALLAGEIDASPLELVDAVALEKEAGGRFERLTTFADSLEDVHPTTLYGDGAYMSDNPDVARDLLAALLEQNRKISEDPAYLADLIRKHLDDSENVDQVAELYAPLFPADGGLDEAAIEATIDFAVDADAIDDGLSVDDAAELSYLEDVREDLGE